MPIRSSKRPAFAENTTSYVCTLAPGDGPLVNAPIGPTVGVGFKLLVYQLSAKSSSSTARNLPFRIGFGSGGVLPAPSVSGTPGMLLEGELEPGGEAYANPGIGLPGQRLLMTAPAPDGEDGKFWTSFYCELIEV